MPALRRADRCHVRLGARPPDPRGDGRRPAFAVEVQRSLAGGGARRLRRRLDAARPCRAPVGDPRRRALPQARGPEPDTPAQGPRPAATGLEAIVLAPLGWETGAVAARHPGARVFAVDGTYDDCRRLELELGSLFPWGFVRGNPHPHASGGAKEISFEIAQT